MNTTSIKWERKWTFFIRFPYFLEHIGRYNDNFGTNAGLELVYVPIIIGIHFTFKINLQNQIRKSQILTWNNGQDIFSLYAGRLNEPTSIHWFRLFEIILHNDSFVANAGLKQNSNSSLTIRQWFFKTCHLKT